MRKRKRIFSLLIVCAALTLILFQLFWRATGEGPVCNGRPLSEWVEIIGQQNSGKHVGGIVFFEAEDAIQRTGTNAIPFLLKWIRSETTPPTDKLPPPIHRFLAKFPRIYMACMPRSFLRASGSMDAFLLVRTNITAATVDELTRLMNTTTAPNTASRATSLLGQIGPAGVPPLAAIVDNPQHPMNWLAVRVVFLADDDFGPAAEAFVLPLIKCLSNTTLQTDSIAAGALGNLKMSPQITVPALISCVNSPDWRVRRAVASSLVGFPGQTSVTLPVLTNLLADQEMVVRQEATNAVAEITRGWPANTPPN